MTASVKSLVSQPYKYGFTTDIEADTIPRGLTEDTVRLISAKKNEPEFMLEFRLKAYRKWLTMTEPDWPNVGYPPISYQDIIYYSAPRQEKKKLDSLDDADPALLETFEKLGIPVINMIQVSQTAEGWMENDKGIKVYRRANELSVPEQMGSIQPIVTTSREITD